MRTGDLSRGFTLVELAAIVTIIGLATTLAWPVFRNATRRLERRAAADRLEADLRAARLSALTSGRDITTLVAGTTTVRIRFAANGTADPMPEADLGDGTVLSVSSDGWIERRRSRP